MERRTGVVVPLAALYTKDCAAVGDFLALKPFADFCERCGLRVIQLLPVNDTGTHSSPYSGLSAFALHPLYIRLEALPEFEDAKKNDKAFAGAYNSFVKDCKYRNRFDYTKVSSEKIRVLHLLYTYIEKKMASKAKPAAKGTVQVATADDPRVLAQKFTDELDAFAKENAWIIPYAVFKNLKDDHSQASWKSWEEDKRTISRKQIELRWQNKALKSSHNFFVWCQLRASQQFKEAADYVRSKGILLKGDIPILMNEDSADCWAWPEFFNQELRAGSPPDGENPMGQNWGFPTYSWDTIAADGYTWWKDRVRTAAQYYSAFRIDHILGFFRIWAVRQSDSTAYLGHTVPCRTISRKELNELGFDDGRIHWLAEPHIPTGLIEDITWNHQEAHEMLRKVADQLGSEELWNFKKELSSDGQIYAQRFADDPARDGRVKDALAQKWRDRSLIELAPGQFIPVWSFGNSTAWKTLGWDEQQRLQQLFSRNAEQENELWKQQALSVLRPIVAASGMAPCAEDLGANLAAMPDVLRELGILSLKVIRWNRDWAAAGQPFVPFKDYPELSVATTSVHDSSTLRQWWNEEKASVEAYLKLEEGTSRNAAEEFTPDTAEFVLQSSARCGSAWFIPPLQDYLFLDKSYYLDNPQDERINVPGSVNDFNWTYRLPADLEALAGNTTLIEKIHNISQIHDNLSTVGGEQ